MEKFLPDFTGKTLGFTIWLGWISHGEIVWWSFTAIVVINVGESINSGRFHSDLNKSNCPLLPQLGKYQAEPPAMKQNVCLLMSNLWIVNMVNPNNSGKTCRLQTSSFNWQTFKTSSAGSINQFEITRTFVLAIVPGCAGPGAPWGLTIVTNPIGGGL